MPHIFDDQPIINGNHVRLRQISLIINRMIEKMDIFMAAFNLFISKNPLSTQPNGSITVENKEVVAQDLTLSDIRNDNEYVDPISYKSFTQLENPVMDSEGYFKEKDSPYVNKGIYSGKPVTVIESSDLKKVHGDYKSMETKMDGMIQTMNMMMKRMDEQSKRLDAQDRKIEDQQRIIEKQQQTIDKQQKTIDKQQKTINAQNEVIKTLNQEIEAQNEIIADLKMTIHDQGCEIKKLQEENEKLIKENKTVKSILEKSDKEDRKVTFGCFGSLFNTPKEKVILDEIKSVVMKKEAEETKPVLNLI